MNRPIVKVVLSLPLILLSAVLFWLSSLPDLTPPDLGFNFQDKLYHAIAYFVYGSCAVLFVLAWFGTSTTRALRIYTLLIASLFALSDELHQYFVPTRHASFGDWIADVIGIICSLLLLTFFRKFFLKVG